MINPQQNQPENQKHLDDLAMRCIVNVDHNGGHIIEKHSTGVSTILAMERRAGLLDISFRVMSHAQGNGSSKVVVKYDGNVVLDAAGKFMGEAYDMQAKVYVPGKWEQEIQGYRKEP